MQRKGNKTTRATNARERAYIGWVKHRPCCVCKNEPCYAHHCIGSSRKIKVNFATVLIGPWFVIPLCQSCDDVITHGSRRAFVERFGLQADYALSELEEYPESVPEEVLEGIRLWQE